VLRGPINRASFSSRVWIRIEEIDLARNIEWRCDFVIFLWWAYQSENVESFPEATLHHQMYITRPNAGSPERDLHGVVLWYIWIDDIFVMCYCECQICRRNIQWERESPRKPLSIETYVRLCRVDWTAFIVYDKIYDEFCRKIYINSPLCTHVHIFSDEIEIIWTFLLFKCLTLFI